MSTIKKFKGIGNYKAVKLYDSLLHFQIYKIQDGEGQDVALVSSTGTVSFIDRTFSNTSHQVDPITGLEQAVRYVYLMQQQRTLVQQYG